MDLGKDCVRVWDIFLAYSVIHFFFFFYLRFVAEGICAIKCISINYLLDYFYIACNNGVAFSSNKSNVLQKN